MITTQRLRTLLEYNPLTGEWKWRVNRRGGAKAGQFAGTIDRNGYVTIGVDGGLYKAHRLAWLYMTESWPRDQIDHIDRDKTNCRWSNLREATTTDNAGNSKIRKNNKSGFKGVSPHRKKWQVSVAHKHIGVFNSKDSAHAAYAAAAAAYFGEFARAE